MHQSCKSALDSYDKRLKVLESNRYHDFGIEMSYIHRKMRDIINAAEKTKQKVNKITQANEKLTIDAEKNKEEVKKITEANEKLTIDAEKNKEEVKKITDANEKLTIDAEENREEVKRIREENEKLKEIIIKLSNIVREHGDAKNYKDIDEKDTKISEDSRSNTMSLSTTTEDKENVEMKEEKNIRKDYVFKTELPTISEAINAENKVKEDQGIRTIENAQDNTKVSLEENDTKEGFCSNFPLNNKEDEVTKAYLIENIKYQNLVLNNLTEEFQALKDHFAKVQNKRPDVNGSNIKDFPEILEIGATAVQNVEIKLTKNIQCWYCPRKFYILSGLTSHMKMIHKDVDAVPKYPDL